jgi:hypothetical protein
MHHLLGFRPMQATEKGLYAHDHRLPAYGTDALETFVAGCRYYIARIDEEIAGARDPDAWIDLQAVRSNLATALFWLADARWHEVNPLVYVEEALGGVHALLLQEHRPLPVRLSAVASRLTAFPRLLREARLHLAGPWRLFLRMALESATDGQLFLKELARRFPELRGAVRDARRALDGFARHLERLEADAAERIALGAERYRRLLVLDSMLEPDDHALVRIGEAMLATLSGRMAAARASIPGSVGEVPADFGREEVLAYYRWEIDQVRSFVAASNLVTLPEGDSVRIVEAPPFLEPLLPPVCYQPPAPFDSDRTGCLFLSPMVPQPLVGREREAHWREKELRSFRKEIVHELYPGHHVQMLTAGDHASPVRRSQANDLFVEGWALYCEELMERAGLYGSDAGPSTFALYFRAARLVIDVKLQTGAFGVDDAVRYFRELLGPEHESWYRREVLRYLTEPTQAMSYLVGKLAIEALRDEVADRERRRFSLRRFHDRMLAEGSVAPALLAAKPAPRSRRLPPAPLSEVAALARGAGHRKRPAGSGTAGSGARPA